MKARTSLECNVMCLCTTLCFFFFLLVKCVCVKFYYPLLTGVMCLSLHNHKQQDAHLRIYTDPNIDRNLFLADDKHSFFKNHDYVSI